MLGKALRLLDAAVVFMSCGPEESESLVQLREFKRLAFDLGPVPLLELASIERYIKFHDGNRL